MSTRLRITEWYIILESAAFIADRSTGIGGGGTWWRTFGRLYALPSTQTLLLLPVAGRAEIVRFACFAGSFCLHKVTKANKTSKSLFFIAFTNLAVSFYKLS